MTTFAIALLAGGCSIKHVEFTQGGGDGGVDTPADVRPIKVGLLAPKTGALSSVGSSFERVANAAVQTINANGGADGRPLELLVADSETMPTIVATKLDGLIDMGVVAVVGPATSGEVTTAFPVARDSKVPIISPSSAAASLSAPPPVGPDDGGYMFRNISDDDTQGYAMAHYLIGIRQPTISSVAVVYEDTAYGVAVKNAFTSSFTTLGGTVTQEVSFAQNLADVTAADPTIDALVAANPDPTFVVLIGLEQDALYITQAWDSGGSPRIAGLQFFYTDGARSQGFLTAAPALARGMCGTAPTYPMTSAAYTTLQTAYEAMNGDLVADQVFAPNVWDAFHLIAAATVQQRQAYPGEEVGGEHLRDAITLVARDGQALHAGQWSTLVSTLRAGTDIDYDGAAGPNDFDANGQAVGPYEVWCIAADGASFTQATVLDASAIQALEP